MPLTKLRKHNPVKLLFLISVMPKTERIIFMLTIPFLFCFSFSENGRRNAAESTPYLWLLPAADYGHKNNTPSECATTESYNIHERLLKKRYNNKEVIHPGNCLYQIFSFTFQLPHKKRSYYISPFLSA